MAICEGLEDWGATDLSALSDSDEEDQPAPLVRFFCGTATKRLFYHTSVSVVSDSNGHKIWGLCHTHDHRAKSRHSSQPAMFSSNFEMLLCHLVTLSLFSAAVSLLFYVLKTTWVNIVACIKEDTVRRYIVTFVPSESTFFPDYWLPSLISLP